jgi:pyruvate,water dikinase
VAEGSALILDQSTRVDESGYVLVCSTSDPAWTPLMLRASAVIFESSGRLSHGAIVAREFGLPAVGGIANATSQFQNGQRLRVDGKAGVVTVLGDAD